MIKVTPTHQPFANSHQVFDEQQALLTDLRQHPEVYLEHRDPIVVERAGLAMSAWQMQVPEGSMRPWSDAYILLGQLYRYLRTIADKEDN
jgi:hypothetical protein